MPSQLHRSTVCKLLVIATAGAICGIPWSANAVQSVSHARAAAAELTAFISPAMKRANEAIASKIDFVETAASLGPARRYASSIRHASLAWAAALLPALSSLPDPLEQVAAAPTGTTKPALPKVQSRTAVYDISARTVFLPDGRKLEAHSGLGKFTDDPRSVKEKNRGVTPPNVYDLSLREQPFHGVRALRLTPVSEKSMYGRDGILAHTYMLNGGKAQSNGCVVFKDYDVFLQAYLSGEVDRLVVVTSMTAGLPSNVRMAAGEARVASE